MVLELHVWGPAFGLPSIDAECIATIAYLNRIVPHPQWVLIANHDTSISPRGEFPVLIDGPVRETGFLNIVSYLRNHLSGPYDLDDHLTRQRQTDRTACLSFLQSTAGPLIDLYLYVSSENYYSTTSSSYTAILPWYLNYTFPPTRRDLARSRTAHLGLSSLDVSTKEQDGSAPGAQTLRSDFEAAKRDAGMSNTSRMTQPKVLSMGRGKGIQGLLSSPIYAARFKLDTLTNELLEPLSDILGENNYLLEADRPSSLDCFAFGYLALMFYPLLPQAWLKEALQSRFPRIVTYVERMREELIGPKDVSAADIWALSAGSTDFSVMSLPWRPTPSRQLHAAVKSATQEIMYNFPILSKFLQPSVVIQAEMFETSKWAVSSLPAQLSMNVLYACSATIIATLAGLAIHHRRHPREGDLIFWALRPRLQGLGEAGNILSVLAHQLPRGPVV